MGLHAAAVMFLVGATWLAIDVWLSEQGALLAAAAVAGVSWRPRASVGA